MATRNAAEPVQPAGSPPSGDRSRPWNLPNQITAARLVLAVVSLVLVDWSQWLAGGVVFTVAVGTDFVDGYLARRYNQITVLGRVLDPLVDKLVVGGMFIFLATGHDPLVPRWIVVIVIGRELAITSLRGLLEGAGHDFSAAMLGKLKMVVQSIAIGCVLLELHAREQGEWAGWLPSVSRIRVLLLSGTVAITLYSGYVYIERALKMFRASSRS